VKREEEVKQAEVKESVKEQLRTPEIGLCLGRQVAAQIQGSHAGLHHRVAKMRRKFARQYGFVVPDIKLTDSLNLPPKTYQIRIHGTVAAT
ncbi:FHIPEP family type III secretion protein, partial [Klebsiella pneumoniae]|uniref:FHIPEP family type III secretion protein n=1 Tax=Klebsiella pneumoniae TaxID=573 RepID=UPI001BE105DC